MLIVLLLLLTVIQLQLLSVTGTDPLCWVNGRTWSRCCQQADVPNSANRSCWIPRGPHEGIGEFSKARCCHDVIANADVSWDALQSLDPLRAKELLGRGSLGVAVIRGVPNLGKALEDVQTAKDAVLKATKKSHPAVDADLACTEFYHLLRNTETPEWHERSQMLMDQGCQLVWQRFGTGNIRSQNSSFSEPKMEPELSLYKADQAIYAKDEYRKRS
eukprot:TRINITY_DN6922_c0_g1_i2.p1 TRINITY_DN6922_c0_g1~~TRINITY_DN6922_c0_g1_i2.p1  ORF type:complete len:217 (-),score=34.29 TRINITY_DN6922_c0_g1_i2:894-1544(-)